MDRYGRRGIDLDVTQRNIDEGKQNSGGDCAIARSIKDRGARSVHVNSMGAFVDHQRFDIGDKGREFVHKFDADKSLVSPIQLTLSPYFSSAGSVQEYEARMYQHQMMAYKIPMKSEFWNVGEVPKMMETTVKYKPVYFGMDFGV